MVLPDDLCHLRVYDSGYLSPIVWTTFQESVNVEDREDRPVLRDSDLLIHCRTRNVEISWCAVHIQRANVCLCRQYCAGSRITKYLTKVSIHTWGITGPSVPILSSFGALPFLVLVVGLVVGTARVTLGYHTWAQVALSFLTAVPFTWLILYIVPIAVPTVFRS